MPRLTKPLLIYNFFMQELKVRISSPQEIEDKLKKLGAVFQSETFFVDIYFKQPSGKVLKISDGKEGPFLFVIEKRGDNFEIVKREKVENVEELREELSVKHGVKKVLRGILRFFSLNDYKITIDVIDNVGNFLIVTGENPTKDFVEKKLGIQNPEYITVSFDDLPHQ